MRDPEVEGSADDRAADLEGPVVVAEVVPEPQGDRGKEQPATAAPPVLHPVVAILCGDEGHAALVNGSWAR